MEDVAFVITVGVLAATVTLVLWAALSLTHWVVGHAAARGR